MKSLVLALIALLFASSAHAVCTPVAAKPGMMGCEPIATSVTAATDYVQVWIPGAYPNSAKLITLTNLMSLGLPINATTLTVSGNATIGGTLGVTGATTLSGAANVGLTLVVAGATTLQSTLGVTGATSLLSTLAVTSNATIGGTLGVTSSQTIGGTLGVTGATTTGGLTSTSGTFTGALTASPASANVVFSPTGTGLVTINPATLGSMDNMTIGATTRAAVSGTTGNFNSTFTLSGGTLAVAGNTSIGVATSTVGAGTYYAGHGLINVQTFCASGCTATGGTYTASAGTNQVLIKVQAPGGGGAGCGATGGATICVGGSGAGGSYAEVLYTSAFSGITMTVGAAGTAGTSAPTLGGTGGTTSAGALISCPGGIGGPVGVTGAAASYVPIVAFASAPSTCTIAGGTTLTSVGGQPSGLGFAGAVTASSQYPGAGGSSVLGMGPPSFNNAGATSTGSAGVGYGWGAGGSINSASQSATAGRTGGPAIIIVYEYN